MTGEKRCYSCGSKRDLKKVKNAIAETTGYYVPIEEGWACKSCLENKKILIRGEENVH